MTADTRYKSICVYIYTDLFIITHIRGELHEREVLFYFMMFILKLKTQ